MKISGKMCLEIRRTNGEREKFAVHNQITTEGLTTLFNALFAGGSALSFYIGLINNSGFSALSRADTPASHGGWSEWTGYSGSRPAWSLAIACTGAGPITLIVTNPTSVSITATSAGTLYGAFVASAASGTGGILWAEIAFPATKTLASGDTLTITSYTITATA